MKDELEPFRCGIGGAIPFKKILPRFRIVWFLGDPVIEPLNKAAAQVMNDHLDKILKDSL